MQEKVCTAPGCSAVDRRKCERREPGGMAEVMKTVEMLYESLSNATVGEPYTMRVAVSQTAKKRGRETVYKTIRVDCVPAEVRIVVCGHILMSHPAAQRFPAAIKVFLEGTHNEGDLEVNVRNYEGEEMSLLADRRNLRRKSGI